MDADKHSFSLLPASVLVGEQIISAYCWVLREHVKVFLSRQDIYMREFVSLSRGGGDTVSV